MNICFIGKHKYPKDIFSNEQDMKTWGSLAVYFNNLFVIAQSPNMFFYKAKNNNINIYLVPNIFGYIGFIKQAICLGFYLNWRYKIDIFDASEIIGGGITATILKFFTQKKTVVEVQGEIFRKSGNEQNIRSLFLQLIGRYVIKKAALVRVISNAIFNQVCEHGISESKIRLVSLRVDLTLFNPTSDVGEKVDKVGISNITHIGYIGRLVEGKGLEDLLHAVANLNFQFPIINFHLLIYGTGPLEHRLRKIAEDLKISNKIEWLGFVPYSKVPEALANIDIFVYPSWHEGFGRSIMEALAMEKAVVATRVGGIPDLIKDGENGFLVEPHNPEALALKIKELMENKDLRERFGKAGRKFVSENFEWNDGIKKFAQLFLGLDHANK